jgi:hypothetical protein
MVRSIGGSLFALVLTLGLVDVARAQPTVDLGFSGPASLSGPAGSVQTASYFCTLTQLSGSTGAPAWQIIFDADNAQITSVTIAGTDADALVDRTPCFGLPECSFVTTQMGSDLGCSAVLLSLQSPITLPATGTSTIARFDISAIIPPCGGSVTLHYVDEAGCFAGVAATNVVTLNGASQSFANGLLAQEPLTANLVPTTPCDPKVLIQDLITTVNALDASRGTKNVLALVLNSALGFLSDNSTANDPLAEQLLRAFIALVNQFRGHQLTPADADLLTAAAQAILAVL